MNEKLRGAYYTGIDDENGRPHSGRGVTAGLQAMQLPTGRSSRRDDPHD